MLIRLLLLYVIALPALAYNKLGFRSDYQNFQRVWIDSDFTKIREVTQWLDSKPDLEGLPRTFKQVNHNTVKNKTLIITKIDKAFSKNCSCGGQYRARGAVFVDKNELVFSSANLIIPDFNFFLAEHEWGHMKGRGHETAAFDMIKVKGRWVKNTKFAQINGIMTPGGLRGLKESDKWIEQLIDGEVKAAIVSGNVYGDYDYLQFKRMGKKQEKAFDMKRGKFRKHRSAYIANVKQGRYEIELPSGRYRVRAFKKNRKPVMIKRNYRVKVGQERTLVIGE